MAGRRRASGGNLWATLSPYQQHGSDFPFRVQSRRGSRMGRSRTAWVGSTVAPWGIALCFLVSITAQAGEEVGVDPLSLRISAFIPASASARPIVEASLTLEVDGRRYELAAGDAYFFDSRKPHGFRNAGDGELVVVSACAPPTF